jgi:hypothetical protein
MASILSQKKAYSAYYGDFRGVDFSSDHTQVLNQRLAYSKNMYKDYQSGDGKAIETIPGYRKRFSARGLGASDAVRGVHVIRFVSGDEHILVHVGNGLYRWGNYPKSINVVKNTTRVLGDMVDETASIPKYRISLEDIAPEWVESVTKADGKRLDGALWNFSNSSDYPYTLSIATNELQKGDSVTIGYFEGLIDDIQGSIFEGMANETSTSFVFGDKLYVLDGKNYLVYDGDKVSFVSDNAYVPTTYIDVVPGGDAKSAGREYEQRNLLTPYFKTTFIADGETDEYFLNDKDLQSDIQIEVYGKILTAGEYEFSPAEGRISFNDKPMKPEDAGFPENYAGVVVKAAKTHGNESAVQGCTITAVFDERPFFAGNPETPSRIYYCGRNAETGLIDPSYIPMLHRVEAGTTNVPVKALLPVADTLMALKGDTQQDGSVYYFSPSLTEDNVVPVIYQSVRGLAGIGCLGAACNFLDDPVFVSRLGLEAVGQLSTRLERAIEHRSYLVDAKLCNLDLSKAKLAEWNGYLWLLCEGKVFMADSRQRFTHESGVMQYEWYYLEDVGHHVDPYDEYRYAALHEAINGATVTFAGEDGDIELPLKQHGSLSVTANPPAEDGRSVTAVKRVAVKGQGAYEGKTYYVDFVVEKTVDAFTQQNVYNAFYVQATDAKIGGQFFPATGIYNIDGNVFFGTDSGVLFSFNFDQRDENGEISPRWYDFDGHAIQCGCATKMDSCGIPGMTKTTVKKSTVIKTKTLPLTAARIKVRTNKKPYEQIARIGSARFSFDDVDFGEFSFLDTSESLFAVKEKEKKWVEKQYYLYSDEYQRPFALYYITYRYTVAGRYKQ